VGGGVQIDWQPNERWILAAGSTRDGAGDSRDEARNVNRGGQLQLTRRLDVAGIDKPLAGQLFLHLGYQSQQQRTTPFDLANRWRGRWEAVLPGDPEPSEDDLLTEATLPVERRALQRRWTLVERFEKFLPPTGEVILPGPDPSRMPVSTDGTYKLLLRIEASDDKEATSNAGGGRPGIGGGVTGSPIRVLRYVVGGMADAIDHDRATAHAPVLIGPAPMRLTCRPTLHGSHVDGAALSAVNARPRRGVKIAHRHCVPSAAGSAPRLRSSFTNRRVSCAPSFLPCVPRRCWPSPRRSPPPTST
jgi:hypothetical protein